MKDQFKEFYQIDKSNLWNTAIFVFDTNVLLNLYRYGKQTRNRVFEIIKHFKKRIWMPYQIGLEYHRNRMEVIYEQELSYDKIHDSLEKHKRTFIENLNEDLKIYKKRHPTIDIVEHIEKIERTLEEEMGKIKTNKKEHPEFSNEDVILTSISDIFSGKVGSPLTEDEIKQITDEGEQRYKNKIPPGFKDKEKKDILRFNEVDIPVKFGDLIIWKEIMQYSKTHEVPIIFVTDDEKEDWWEITHGKTIGPRYELLNEFRNETGQEFHMYKSYRFIETFSEKEEEIELDTINEIKSKSTKNATKNEIDNNHKLIKLDTNKLNKEIMNSFFEKNIPNFLERDFFKSREELEELSYKYEYLLERLIDNLPVNLRYDYHKSLRIIPEDQPKKYIELYEMLQNIRVDLEALDIDINIDSD